MLQYFKEKGISVLGVEPAANVAEVATAKGIPTIVKFFGAATARELVEKGTFADLIAANNVLAHVPDINDFVEGFSILLKPEGAATFEFPHLLNLIEKNQLDTIYHEHFSYLSLTTVEKIFNAHGFRFSMLSNCRRTAVRFEFSRKKQKPGNTNEAWRLRKSKVLKPKKI